MFGKCGDQIVPLSPIFWRCNIWFVPESVWTVFCRQFIGHEAQFDKRLHTICQQPVVDLIDVRKIVDWPSLAVFVVESEFVVKNRMEAHEFKASSLLYIA